MKLIDLEFTFKTKFSVNLDSYPSGWKKKQILEAELDNFYADPKGYLEVLVDEDDYEVEIT